jgi:hypothetical protein
MNQALGQDNIRSCKNEDVQWMRFHNIHHSKPTMLYINSFPIVLDDGVVVGVIVGVNVGASVYSNVIIRSKMLANE